MKTMKHSEDIRLAFYDNEMLNGIKIMDAESAYNQCIDDWHEIDRIQEFRILLLDHKFNLVSSASLKGKGIRIMTDHPGMLYSTIPTYQAAYIILAHNMPGEANENEILELSTSVIRAAQLMEICVLYNLVVTSYGYTDVMSLFTLKYN